MKWTLALFVLFAAFPTVSMAQVAINEVDYQNPGTDDSEWIELVGRAGTSLDGWTIELVNGFNGDNYNSHTLSGVIPNDFTSEWGGNGGFFVVGQFDAETTAYANANGFQNAPDLTPSNWGQPPGSGENAIQNGEFADSPGDLIRLLDASGNIVDEWSYGWQGDTYDPNIGFGTPNPDGIPDAGQVSGTGDSANFEQFDTAGSDTGDGSDIRSLGRLGYSFDEPYFVFDGTDFGGADPSSLSDDINRFDNDPNNILSVTAPTDFTAPASTGAIFSVSAGEMVSEAGSREIDFSGTLGFGPLRGPTPGAFNNAFFGAGGQDTFNVNISRPIPEPGTFAVLGLALTALATQRRRR